MKRDLYFVCGVALDVQFCTMSGLKNTSSI